MADSLRLLKTFPHAGADDRPVRTRPPCNLDYRLDAGPFLHGVAKMKYGRAVGPDSFKRPPISAQSPPLK